jgi:hypothetical protein
MKNSIVFSFCLFIFLPTFWPPFSDGIIEKLQQALQRYTEQSPEEKTYIHTDKLQYGLGENIWFKAYLVNGFSLQPNALSTVLYVELIDAKNSVKANRNIKIENGGGQGDFFLEQNWDPGTYRIRAFTKYMRNFDDAFLFQKEIQVLPTQQKLVGAKNDQKQPDFNIAFTPEGGDMIAGLPNTVGIKAVNESGTGISLEGKIVDDQGKLVSLFKTFEFGLGVINFAPSPERNYVAEASYRGVFKKIPLPVVEKSGYVLKVNGRSMTTISVNLLTNIPDGLKNIVLIGQMRGVIFFSMPGKFGNEEINLEIPTKDLSEGIAQITVFTEAGEPLCERLVFIENPIFSADLKIEPTNTILKPRLKIDIQLQLSDSFGEPLQGNLSATVTDPQTVLWPINGMNIKTYLLLQSDLQGRIEDPAYFFDSKNSNRRNLLDLLLLTQGWRRFTWKAILADSLPQLQFLPENGFSIAGVTKKTATETPVKADLMVSSLNNGIFVKTLVSDEAGKFILGGLDLTDTTKIFIQANRYKERKKIKENASENQGPQGNRFVDIILEKNNSPKISPLRSDKNIQTLSDEKNNAFIEKTQKIQHLDSVFRNGVWNITLSEFEVASKKKYNNSDTWKGNYSNPSRRIDFDSIPGAHDAWSVFDIIRARFPEIRVIGGFPSAKLKYRSGLKQFSGNSPEDSVAIFLDGMQIDDEWLNLVNAKTVAYIDLLNTGQAQGLIGTSPYAISVFTRQDVGSGIVPGIMHFKHPGYYKAREFYAPSYDKKLLVHEKPDYRTTLFWEPSLQTDEKGQASLSFYADDIAKGYDLLIEGITSAGFPVYGRLKIGK